MSNSIRIRARYMQDLTTVEALIAHPMETGLRRDPASGELVPAHFIKEIAAEHAGRSVFHAYWGTAISKNPYLSFRFEGARPGDTLKLSWMDNKGQSDSIETEIKEA